MKQEGISVIILNWNGRDFLAPCLNSLQNQLEGTHEVIVVDNGSTDGSVGYLQEHYPWVRLVPLKKNIGFAAGNNRGVKQAKKKWVFLLNNDTVAEPSLLRSLCRGFEEHPTCHVFSCRMLGMDPPHTVDNIGISPSLWTPGRQIKNDPEIGREVFGPSGGAALIDKDLYVDSDGFDEDFFAYCEDTDLAWRLRLCGSSCRYLPDAVVYHYGSGSSGAGSFFANKFIQRNQELTYFKNYSAPAILLTFPIHAAYNLFYLVRMAFHGQARAWFLAKSQFFDLSRRVRIKRKVIQRRRKVSRWRSLLWALGKAPR